jgi:molybdate transport system permease protein
MSGRRVDGEHLPAPVLAVAAVAAALFTLPLVGLVHRTSWSSLGRALSAPEATDALRLSLVCSVAAVVLATLLGLPLAWVLARSEGRLVAVVRGIFLLPMVLPPVVGGVALLSAFSLRSPMGRWLDDALGIQLTFTTAGAVLAATFVSMPFFVLTAEGALRGADRGLEEAAANLGASRFVTFRRVTLPLIAPSLVAGGALTWARALGEFGATITFAGNVRGRTRTAPLAIYQLLESDRDAALALSAVLVGVSLAVLVALRDRWGIRT